MSRSGKAWVYGAVGLLALCIGAASLVLYSFNPAQSAFYPFCLFHRMTGLLCPGCGSLRALHQLLHGHLGAAFHCNALLVLSLPGLMLWAGYRFAGKLRKEPPRLAVRPAWVWSAAVVVVVFGVLRNLPLTQLAFLAP